MHAIASTTPTGVDQQTAIILGFPHGQQAVLHTQLDARGPGTAVVIGTEGRIEFDQVWYTPTSWTAYDPSDAVIARFDQEVEGRGMQFQAWALEAIVAIRAADGHGTAARGERGHHRHAG